ncbi:YmfQ family protein [Cedecea neteri]|uniref:YmfQ family protein n=1 Tax=Cedecea neteri TaxID=158822 RepID=UPI002AA7ED31|nr:YmfQ family protein [Cedecea neteri]WPU22555.1 YmfQ family protein [Cedecea neteri]
MSYYTLLNLLLPKVSYSPNQPVLTASLQAEANMFDQVDNSANLVKGGVTPYMAMNLLADWERVLGITSVATASYQQRQQRVLAKLAETGGLSIPYFTRLASSLGYTITIDEPQPFRAGINRAGDELFVEDIIWVWVVNVQNSNTLVYRFRSGNSAAGERLTSFGDPVIEEVFEDLKPAHTFCYFAYQGNP